MSIQRTTLLRELREAKSLPYNGCAAPLAHSIHRRMHLFPIHSYFLPTPTQVGAAGRVREVPYRYGFMRHQKRRKYGFNH